MSKAGVIQKPKHKKRVITCQCTLMTLKAYFLIISHLYSHEVETHFGLFI